jgi:hypothetical protein
MYMESGTFSFNGYGAFSLNYADSGVSPSSIQSDKLVPYIPANVFGGNRHS